MNISKRSARRFKKHHRVMEDSLYKHLKIIAPPFTREGYSIWVGRMYDGSLVIFESQTYGD
jgi:hypothetical protein